MNKSALKNATTGLAGAVALAGGTQAYGAVVTVAVPATISASASNTDTTIFYDINGDGTPDFQITCAVGAGTSTSGTAYAFSLAGIAGAYQAYNAFGFENRVVGYTTSFGNYASRLATGTSIGASSAFVYGNYLTVLGSRFNGKSYGALRTKGYIGVEFAAADGEHFGYINLKATVAGTGTTDTNYTASLAFSSAGYESTPGVSILAGAKAVPEPTSLGALAFGAAGVAAAAAYRRKKAAQPAA